MGDHVAAPPSSPSRSRQAPAWTVAGGGAAGHDPGEPPISKVENETLDGLSAAILTSSQGHLMRKTIPAVTVCC